MYKDFIISSMYMTKYFYYMDFLVKSVLLCASIYMLCKSVWFVWFLPNFFCSTSFMLKICRLYLAVNTALNSISTTPIK